MLVCDLVEALRRFPQTDTVFIDFDGVLKVEVVGFMFPCENYNGTYRALALDYELPWINHEHGSTN